MEKNNKPQLHFSNNYDWTRTTFGETILSLKSGLSRMLSSDDIGLPVVRANNINQGNLDLNNNVKYWYKEDPQGANTDNYLIEKNDLLINFINSENKMGTTALVKENPIRPTIYTTNILNLRVKSKIDSYFIFMITQNFKYKRYIKLITKPAVNQSSFTTVDFKKFSFKLPSYEEQKKIGLFFKNLDDSISLHQQELDALKQTKQGFLQKMFPREDKIVPEIRFTGFEDEWNEYKLGDTMKVTSVKRIHQSDWTDSGVRFLRARDIVSTFNKKKVSDYLYISTDKYEEYSLISGKVSKNDILVTGVGSIGVPMLITDDNPIYFKDGNIIWFKNEDTINGYFLYYSFVGYRIQKFIKNIAGIGTVGTYTIDSGKKTPILLPSEEEQIKIGKFFRQLDEVIELKEQELEALKQTKKGFLQKMFV